MHKRVLSDLLTKDQPTSRLCTLINRLDTDEVERLPQCTKSLQELIDEYDATTTTLADVIKMCQVEHLEYKLATLTEEQFYRRRNKPLRYLSTYDYIPHQSKLIGVFILSQEVCFGRYDLIKDDLPVLPCKNNIFLEFDHQPRYCHVDAFITGVETIQPTQVVFICKPREWQPPKPIKTHESIPFMF